MGSAAKPLHLTVGERGDREEMKNKSRSRGCAEGWLRRGVIFAGRVGSAGVTAGEGIRHSHPGTGADALKTIRRAGQRPRGWLYPRGFHGCPKPLEELRRWSHRGHSPCRGMVPACSAAASPSGVKGMHTEEEREGEEMRW